MLQWTVSGDFCRRQYIRTRLHFTATHRSGAIMARLLTFRLAQWILVFLLHSAISIAQQTEERQWGPWTSWSVCNRSCGTGLAYRIRRCHNTGRSATDTEAQCSGDDKQYQACNREECPGGREDYRSVECRKYNRNFYGGRRYEWEAFINPYARCELACKARHHRYYARFQKTVEDGTKCKPDEDALCLAGQCLDVGCDGILGSGSTVDQCGVCGGNGSTCRVISGIFTQMRLTHSGYHHVTTIPTGACNINITELARSRNYLALSTARSSILNGDLQLRPIGKYPGAGTEFDYRRRSGPYCPWVCIFADGPLTEPVEVKLLYYDRNPGIMYHFTVPQDTADKVMSAADTSHHRQQRHRHHHHHHHSNGNQHNQDQNPHDQDFPVDSTNDGDNDDDSRHSDINHRDNTHRKHARTRPSHVRHKHDKTDDDLSQSDASDVTTASLRDEPFPSRDSRYESSWRHSYARGRDSRGYASAANPPEPSSSTIPRQANVASGPLFVPPEEEGAPVEYRHYYHTDSEDYRRLTQRQGFAALDSNNVLGGAAGSEALLKPNIIPATRDAQARWRDRNRPWGSSYNGVDNRLNSVGDIPLSVPASGSFVWAISGFTACSEPCGGGVQQTQVVCMKSDTRVVVISENCDLNARPSPTTVECNTQPCPARWTAEAWSDCSVTCGHGLQTRTVECKQRISPTLHLSVSADRCTDLKPPVTQFCRRPLCYQWRASNWTKCSTDCGLGERTRTIACVSGEGEAVTPTLCPPERPKTTEICDMGSCAKGWYYTRWTRRCSPECGKTYKTRQIYCAAEDGSTLPGEKCPPDQKPRIRKSCGAAKPCGGKWFAGPWAECNVTCGEGWRTREVVCMKKHGRRLWSLVGKENCVRKERPPTREQCTELPPCQPEWYTTHWTDCSASCGTGTKTREVKCLDAALQPSLACSAKRRPKERIPCNRHSCDGSDYQHNYDTDDDDDEEHDGYHESTSPNVTITRFHRNRTRSPAPLRAAPPAEIVTPLKDFRSAQGDVEHRQIQTRVDTHRIHHQPHRPHRPTDQPQPLTDQPQPPTDRPHLHRHRHHSEDDHDVAKDTDDDVRPDHPDEEEDPNCTDKPNQRWCMIVSQARLCRYPHYKHQCCKTCKKYDH